MLSYSRSMIALWLLLMAGVTGAAQQAPEHQAPPDNVQGSWTIYSKNVEDGETVKKFVHLNQDGHHVSGNFRGPNQSGRIHGFVNGHHIEFSTETHNVLTFRGRVEIGRAHV